MKPLPGRDRAEVVDRTGRLWERLCGRDLVITGATGFFGRWMLETVLEAEDTHGLGVRVHALTRDAAGFGLKAPHMVGHPALTVIEGDVRHAGLPALDDPFVLHMATEASAQLNSQNGRLMLDTIVDGTRHMLDYAQAHRASRFLFVSSGAVYGPQAPEVSHVAETALTGPDPTAPANAYAEGKRAAETWCALAHAASGLEVPIARCFAFVGPGLPLDRHFAVGNFLKDGLEGGPIRIGGDGTPYRSYMYAADLAVWLWTLLFEGRGGRAYNVGAEEAVSIRELADRVAAAFTPRPEILVARSPLPGAPAARYVPSTARAREELGLSTAVGLDEALRRTLGWHRASEGV